jgi:CRP-like cAMP-binding protein
MPMGVRTRLVDPLYIDVLTRADEGATLNATFESIDTTSDVTRPTKHSSQGTNRILGQLADSDRQTLLAAADRVALAVGHTFARPGDGITSAYFPDTGVFSIVSEMTTGHQVAIAAIGAEGVIGLTSLFGVRQYSHRIVVIADSCGYRVPADQFRRAFEQSSVFRRVTLGHIGGRMSQLVIEAACNRAHSHRQRLARCLLVISDKAGQRSLRLTHEMLAQMVGGPRHAVTVALNELRVKGAIAPLRGRIDIVNRSVLVRHACECYDALAELDHR